MKTRERVILEKIAFAITVQVIQYTEDNSEFNDEFNEWLLDLHHEVTHLFDSDKAVCKHCIHKRTISVDELRYEM